MNERQTPEEAAAQVAREVGRELKADELQPGKIIVTCLDDKPNMFFTAWVAGVGPRDIVWLHAGRINVTLGLFKQPDGTLKDDSGRTIRMFEYLGAE